MVPSLISIIVPVYKVEEYLPHCVESLLAQTYENLEIILVDDGSPDRCPEMCDAYAEMDSRVQVIHKANGGVSSARNLGIQSATGDYIGFVDSDDWIEPDMLEQLVTAMEQSGAQLVSCEAFYDAPDAAHYFADSSAHHTEATFIDVEEPYRDVLTVPQISGYLCNKLFKKELVTRLSLGESLAQNEDLLFVIQYLNFVQKMVHIEKKLYHYRMGNVEPQTIITKRLLTATRAYEKILRCYQENAPHLAWIVERNLLKIFLNFKGRLGLQSGKNNELLQLIKSGIRKHLKAILASSHVSIAEKINIILTGMFPTTMLKLKNKVLTKRHKNGQWTE